MYFGIITEVKERGKRLGDGKYGWHGCFGTRIQINGHVAERPLHALEKRVRATYSGGCGRLCSRTPATYAGEKGKRDSIQAGAPITYTGERGESDVFRQVYHQ